MALALSAALLIAALFLQPLWYQLNPTPVKSVLVTTFLLVYVIALLAKNRIACGFCYASLISMGALALRPPFLLRSYFLTNGVPVDARPPSRLGFYADILLRDSGEEIVYYFTPDVLLLLGVAFSIGLVVAAIRTLLAYVDSTA